MAIDKKLLETLHESSDGSDYYNNEVKETITLARDAKSELHEIVDHLRDFVDVKDRYSRQEQRVALALSAGEDAVLDLDLSTLLSNFAEGLDKLGGMTVVRKVEKEIKELGTYVDTALLYLDEVGAS